MIGKLQQLWRSAVSNGEALSSAATGKAHWQDRQGWRTFYQFYRGHRGQIALAAGYFVFKQSPAWVMPLCTANIIDIISSPHPDGKRALIWNGLALFASLACNPPFSVLYVGKLSQAMRDVEAGLRGALVRRLQELSMAFHQNSNAGALQSKVLRDVEAVDLLARQLFDGCLGCGLGLGSGIIVTAWRTPRFLPLFLVAIPVACGLRLFLATSLRVLNRDFRQNIEKMSARVVGMISMIPMARAHAAEDFEVQTVDGLLANIKGVGWRLDVHNALFQSTAWTVLFSFNMLCLFTGAWLAYTHTLAMTPGEVVMVSSYFGAIMTALLGLLNLLPNVNKGLESVASVSEVLDSAEVEDNVGQTSLPELRGEFCFEQVGFFYGGVPPASLREVTLRVAPGETIGIVGPSGSGKSTLMNLMLGFYRPSSGRILLDGVDLREIDLRAYRRHLAVVSQETLLFDGTLRENILYGARGVSNTRLQDAIRDASAAEFIASLPAGLDTMVGERGARLSGGQRQRVAIARALIRDPRILILDEATSALDVESERDVQLALNRLMHGRTTFIVAHRLATVSQADRIIVLAQGRMVECGTPAELAGGQGEYAKLRTLQMAGV